MSPRPRPLADRFWSKVDRSGGPGSCWPWTASGHYRERYGQFRLGGLVLRAHRVAYELAVGPIADGLTIDHLCRNRTCVNPAHLEPVTRAENTRRGLVARGFVRHASDDERQQVSA